MLVTNAGKIIRIRVNGGEGDSIRVAGRKTQGVRLFEIDKEEVVMSVAIIKDADDEDDEANLDNGADATSENEAESGGEADAVTVGEAEPAEAESSDNAPESDEGEG